MGWLELFFYYKVYDLLYCAKVLLGRFRIVKLIQLKAMQEKTACFTRNIFSLVFPRIFLVNLFLLHEGAHDFCLSCIFLITPENWHVLLLQPALFMLSYWHVDLFDVIC